MKSIFCGFGYTLTEKFIFVCSVNNVAVDI